MRINWNRNIAGYATRWAFVAGAHAIVAAYSLEAEAVAVRLGAPDDVVGWRNSERAEWRTAERASWRTAELDAR